jgi:hypothetical protein
VKHAPDRAKLFFLGSCALLLFGYGFAVGAYRIFPSEAIWFGITAVEMTWGGRLTTTGIKPEEHLELARFDGEGVIRFEEPRAEPGLTLLTGFFEDTNELRLISNDGSVVNRWPVSFSAIFPDPEHILPSPQRPATDWNTDLHGALALPDGSVVFNFEYGGLVKLDRCGAVLWTVPLMTHHSIELTETGTLWVPGRKWVEGESGYPPLEAPYYEDTLLEISRDGEILREISALGLFFKNGLEYLLLSNGSFEVTAVNGQHREVVHLNDIEPLSSEMAPLFPQFSPGDLLLSFRHFNLIMVVDPETETVKFHQTGPWIRQHDPDFTSTGRVSLFNNNVDNDEGRVFGGSNLLEVDPESREIATLFPTVEGESWYTQVRGKHQILENGNTLIVESRAGRIFETTRGGRIVWEFINRYDADEVAQVSDAVRYSVEHFTVSNWSCPN